MARPGEEDGALRSAAQTVPQDWAALARWLEARGMTLAAEPPPRQFAGGFGNLNYRIVVDGRPVVLRRPPAGPLPAGANDMAREHRILSALWRELPLAPRSVAFCPDPAVLGAPFQLIEYRPGVVIRDSLPDTAAGPEAGARLSRGLVETLAALHAVAPAAVGLDTLGRPQGFLGRTLLGWERRGAALADLVEPALFAETTRWLRRQLPPDREAALIHNDFKLDNLILERATLEPVAVIDWDMGTRGDPIWDLAVLLSYWTEPGDPECLHRLRQMPTAEPGFWSRQQVRDAYCSLTGRPVADFRFYRVLALFRSAIVFLQLYDRWRRDPHPDPGAAGFDRIGRDMLAYALDAARGRVG